jgi:HEAT repeat protein
MGTNALAAVPVLLQCLEAQDFDLAKAGLLALKNVRSNGSAVSRSLDALLDSPQPSLRAGALEALAPFPEQAMQASIRALKDADPSVRYTALTMLVEVAPHALTNLTVLTIGAEGLISSTPGGDRQKWAARLLRAAGQKAQGSAPDLMVRMPEGWDLVLREATNALRELAPELLEKLQQQKL